MPVSHAAATNFRDLLAVVFSVDGDEPVLAAAEALADANSQITAALLQIEPDPVYTGEGVMIAALLAEARGAREKHFALEAAALNARAKRSTRPISIRELRTTAGLIPRDLALQARYADLTIALRPSAGSESDRAVAFEGVLFGSGRPVLLIPPDWRGPTLAKRVMVAWNGKREASRAVADAALFLDRADMVAVVTIAGRAGAVEQGATLGVDLWSHLARRCVTAELRNVDGMDRGESSALLAEARALDADLIVMGGYGRSRLSELVLGGVTRELSQTSPIPLFMSH